MKTIFLIRHSGPFVEYEKYDNVKWDEYNQNMILSVTGEEKAKGLCLMNELRNIDKIYSSNSARAIATAKYLAEVNGKKINIDDRINERKLGINLISDLPENFIKNQFVDSNLKYKNGESLNEVNKRFENFINEILIENYEKSALFIHGVVLMSYLSTISNVSFDGEKFYIKYMRENVFEGVMKNPDVFEIKYNDNNEVISIKNL